MTGPDPLPLGFRIALDARVRRRDGVGGGEALLGTVPVRLLHLTATERTALPRDGRLTVDGPDTRRLARALLDAGLAHPVPDPPPPGAPGPEEVTVVVPVRDRSCGRLLAALAAGPRTGGLVVVDDGSADPGPLRRAVAAAGGRLLRHERPLGPAAARNTGLAAARTAYVAFLDSDVVPEPGWLTPLLAHLADPAVALVAPRVVALHPDAGPLARYQALRSALDLGPDPAPVDPGGPVTYLAGAALLLRAAAVRGPAFDPDLHAGEDVDLVRRLHAGGWVVRHEPAGRVAHDHRTSAGAWRRRTAFYGEGAAELARRHPGGSPPATLPAWVAVVCAALGVQRRWAVAAAAVVTGWAALRGGHRLSRLRTPYRAGAALAAFDVVGGAWQLSGALVRAYWPIALLAAVRSRRARRVVLAAALGEGLADRWTHRHRDPRARLGPAGHLLLHRIEDLAYGTGLWRGVLRHRTAAPLWPRLTRDGGPEQRTVTGVVPARRPVRVRGRGQSRPIE